MQEFKKAHNHEKTIYCHDNIVAMFMRQQS